MKQKLALLGAGGHGKVASDIAKQLGYWQEIYFFDDDTNLQYVNDIPVSGTISNLASLANDYDIFVSIGNNQRRKDISILLAKCQATVPSLIHPSSIVSENVVVGRGVLIAAGTVINTNSKIGDFSVVNTGSNIGHDCVIDSYSHIASGCTLAGTVSIGTLAWIGCGTIISNNLSVTSNTVIGSGTLVVKNLEVPGTYVGRPAKITKTNQPVKNVKHETIAP